MKKAFVICALAVIAACSPKKEHNMIVQGQIKGLKKGTLYLQKIVDTALVSVDSISLLGKSDFILTDMIDSPEVYYLTFDGNTTQKSILVFGEEGTITVTDELEKFGIAPKIEGSKNQELLDKYNDMRQQFNHRNLDLLKLNFEAQKEGNKEKMDSIALASETLIKRQYLYATNYALINKEYEVAPYLALTELSNAHIKLLDTINVSLSEKIKNSLYGKKLDKFITEIKETEK